MKQRFLRASLGNVGVFTVAGVFLCSALLAHAISPADPGNWTGKQQKDVGKAIALCTKDPVAAFLLFERVLHRDKEELTPCQKAWLEQQTGSLKPKAIEILEQDYAEAAKADDLRTMLIVSSVSKKVVAGGIETEPWRSEVRNRVSSGRMKTQSVWKISSPTFTPLKGDYEERLPTAHGTTHLKIIQKEGFQLIRAKAEVKNISSSSDPEYALWAMGGSDVTIAAAELAYNFVRTRTQPAWRWFNPNFVYILAHDQYLILPSHVCEGGRGKGVTLIPSYKEGSGRRGIMTAPMPVDEGQTTMVDMIFRVPCEMTEFRLLVVGAPWVKLRKAE